MTMSIGGVNIPADEMPDKGTLPFVRQQRWTSMPAENLIGSIQQYRGSDGLRGSIHFTLSAATLASLKAIYDAQASGGGPYAFIDTDLPEPYASGFDIVITRFDPVLSEDNRGLPWYNTWLDFEEVVS